MPPITYADITQILEKQPFVYLIDHWEGCAIRIGKDENRMTGLRFWQKFRGEQEFESHPDSELVHRAISDSEAIIEDSEGHQRPHTEVVSREVYLRY